MEVKDLMIGDWAITNRSECVGDGGQYAEWKEIGKVTRIYEDVATLLFSAREDDWEEIELKDIEPIPITPEILEKNGFTLEWDGYVLNFNGSGQDYLQVQFKHNGDVRHVEGEVFNQCSFNTRMINYVHELQHALKLCGIDKEIIIE